MTKQTTDPNMATEHSESSDPNTTKDKRLYKFIPNQRRLKFIDMIYNHQATIKEAAIKCAIPYENAKVLNRLFKKEGRILRKNKLL